AYLLFTVLNRLSVKCGIISTVEWGTKDELAPSSMTTPSPTELFKKLSLLKNKGCEFTVMEVSSHGLELERVEPIEFHGTVFTNLSRDHLDFHRDIYSYFLAKEKLFFRSRTSSINADDSFGKVLLGLKVVFPGSLVSYGKGGNFKLISFSKGLLQFELNGKTYKLPTDLKGEFNAYNILAALSLLVAIGFDIEELLPLWRKIRVPGRLEEAAPGVFIDYAHTPDALEKVLKALRKESKGRLITVFGCGGDRDRGKRPQMGKIAEELSDAVVVTSDNPRSEPPEKIAEEILSGMKKAEKAVIILDREEAIKYALKIKKEGDTVLIAGKGHETYQEIKGIKYHFNDREVVEQFYGNR
ncbi:MAG: UDP-N-acetylmuramoyl-L-alanyl-D-glutamate--2,6-diaminopimelate ligase, partial [Desulfurobacteriaceae bacterium]